jgi:hypothetical protein
VIICRLLVPPQRLLVRREVATLEMKCPYRNQPFSDLCRVGAGIRQLFKRPARTTGSCCRSGNKRRRTFNHDYFVPEAQRRLYCDLSAVYIHPSWSTHGSACAVGWDSCICHAQVSCCADICGMTSFRGCVIIRRGSLSTYSSSDGTVKINVVFFRHYSYELT